MGRIERKTALSDEEIEALVTMFAAAARVDDHEVVDRHGWAELARRGRDGFTALVARSDDDDPVPTGYAQVLKEPGTWQLAYVVAPERRRPDAMLGDQIGAELLAAAAAVVAEEGGGRVQLWANRPNPSTDRLTASIGLKPDRSLYQMRRPLPVEPKLATGRSSPLALRAFVPGQDEAAWLKVNNRAFRWHPEQGGWDLAMITGREAEPWFDPDGFLLHEEDGQLLGFCWTKIHADHEPPLGEIYVIAVDPAAGGRGLGRGLVLAGLDHLARAGLQVGMLYCETDNVPAVKLYVDLGFTVDHLDRVYAGDVDSDSVLPSGSLNQAI
jgi:mycothiol synthase